ncbi:MAG: SAM-dependent methyltransferase, partial [bacterium]|nr:SAM-dependent methyltransferase [bacterium]
IAAKTQMFTERYMVEWLLHNSLGLTWLAMCKKHAWTADAELVLDDLDQRRRDWRARRDAGEVALDALMPVAEGLEERWKYFVPQAIPDDAVAAAPASIRELKLLDPACGSGHFLVIAFDLLSELYREEARHRGETWQDHEIAESILENNLFGVDIDPRAIQIAAAGLYLKARRLSPQVRIRRLNLVAPALNLADLPADDPALLRLLDKVRDTAGIPEELTRKLVAALAGVDHLGTLLKVDVAVDEAIADYEQATGTAFGQANLFNPGQPLPGHGHTRATLLENLEAFLAQHRGEEDLGLRLDGEQLAAGLRFIRIVRESTYDIVIGNPPYQGTSKMVDAKYIARHYPRGKADLYAAFLERGLQLARDGGMSALLTMRGWMFISQFAGLRQFLLQ